MRVENRIVTRVRVDKRRGVQVRGIMKARRWVEERGIMKGEAEGNYGGKSSSMEVRGSA